MDPLEALVLQVVEQLEWVHPWAFLLLPLPVLMRLLPAYRERRDAVRVPFFKRLLDASETQPQRGAMLLIRRRGQTVLIALMWLSLILAAAKPQWLGTPIEQQKAAGI